LLSLQDKFLTKDKYAKGIENLYSAYKF